MDTTENLIKRIAEGDMTALEALYAGTKGQVYGYILSILKNAHDSEDVMQDTYVRIYHQAGRYADLGKPLAWIFTIARNLALMKLRAARPLPLGEALPRFDSGAEDRLVLGAVLSTLADTDREIVILHCVAGFRHREIAAFLGIPLATVLSKYHRALSKLRKLLKEDYSHEK